MAKNTGIIVIGILLLLVAVTGFQNNWFKLGTVSTTTTPPSTAPGFAYCAITQATAPIASPPAGCVVQAQILSTLMTDFSTGKALGGTLGCSYRSANGNIIESPTVSSSKCVSGNTYTTGTTINTEFCVGTSTCPPATPYTGTFTVWEGALASPSQVSYGQPNIGAGVVAFSTLASASSAPTLYLVQPIVQIATYTVAVQNIIGGGSQTSSVVCNAASAQTTSISKATYGAKVNIQYSFTVTNTISTPPGGFGWSSWNQLEQGGRNLGAWLRIEVNANGTGTDMPLISGSGFTSPYRPSSTDAFYISQMPDSSITKQTDSNNNPVNGLTGVYVFTVTADLTALGGSDANVRINMIPYFWFSGALYSGSLGSPAGSINAEAQTSLGNFCGLRAAA